MLLTTKRAKENLSVTAAESREQLPPLWLTDQREKHGELEKGQQG